MITQADSSLESAILEALDGLLRALDIQDLNGDRFRIHSEPPRFDRIFGGQLLAQALLAASATVSDKPPHSLHAYFAQSGVPGQPLDISVKRIRDGRSMSARQVTVAQDDRPLLIAMASFHANPPEPEWSDPPPDISQPGELALLQDWAAKSPARLQSFARNWIEKPPPIEFRMAEPLYFLSGRRAEGVRSHWMRLPRGVGDDPLLHSALLTYASDYFLMDMAFRSHPDASAGLPFTGSSLDHAIWLHRPVRFDQWHLYTQQLLALSGQRGLVRGTIHDAGGQLVASTTQEVLVRTNR